MEEERVRFICKRTVVSTKPVEPGQLYRLSVLDHVMEPNHIHLVYYYRSSKTREPGEITKKLRESLAYTLNCYPIITGRLVKEIVGTEEKEDLNRPRWTVKSNDAGVRMVEARATGTVEEWLMKVTREEELKLVHWEDMYHLPYYWSTFYVQVTEFESGGLAIGLSCSHLLADSVCAMMFIRAWAELTLTRTMMAPPLYHSLPPRRFITNQHRVSNNNQLLSHYIKSCTLTSPSNITKDHMVTITLLFPDPLARAIEAEISTFELLVGLFCVCVSRARGKRNELTDITLCFDVRKLLRLDQGYFGNCMVYHKVHFSKPVRTNDRLLLLSQVVQEIHNVTKTLDYDTVMDLIEWLSSNNNPISNCSDLVCTNLENMANSRKKMFEEDLVLSRVSCYVEGPVAGGGQVIVLPSSLSSEGPMSRVVMVSLLQKEMVKILEDELLKSFSPILLMQTENK